MSQPRFKFVGKPKLPNSEAKRPFIKEFTKDGKEMISCNMGIQAGKNSIVFCECFGSVQKNVKTKDTDGNDIEIEWAKRLDKESIKNVANYRKYVCDLGEDFGGRQEFITQWDFIKYLKDNLPNYKGLVSVSGQWTKQWYKDKYYDKFQISSIYSVDSEEKCKFYIYADIYYRKDCIDSSDWKEEKKIYVDGYIQQYINKDEGNKFIPQRFVFNASGYKDDNEQHQKLLAYRKKYVESKSKKWTHLLWDCVMLNGTELVEFDESQLTAAQKEQIELGIRTIDDFKPKGDIFGDIVNEFRFVNPSLITTSSDDFSNGAIELDETDSEFEEMIYHPAQDEKLSEVIESANKNSSKKEEGFDGMNEPEDSSEDDTEIEDDDLF